MPSPDITPGAPCWIDLMTSDTGKARQFYGELFGWTSREQAANGGSFIRLQSSNHDIGSIYQLRKSSLIKESPRIGRPISW